DGGITKAAAVGSCLALSVFYVVVLYSPTLVLRLPPPNSFKSFIFRRFACAAVSTVASLIACALILPVRRLDFKQVLGVYGIRSDHLWRAVIHPLVLTSFMYWGSFASKLHSTLQTNVNSHGKKLSVKEFFLNTFKWAVSTTSDVSSWRTYVVAPLSEELVFRACMIPLLLCGGFDTYNVVFLCPVFFSLAHLNHLYEFYQQKNCSFLKACLVVGFQLGYTVVFGAYASFLIIRTGHLWAPLAAHVFCNSMGLPVIHSRKSGIITAAFAIGSVAFFWMLFPLTSPDLYN
ncbi:hypothetical protein M569_16946, partial [Genlisea aurea]